MVARPAVIYCLEMMALTIRQEAELDVAELKIFGSSLGVTRMYRIGNECVRGTAQVGRI